MLIQDHTNYSSHILTALIYLWWFIYCSDFSLDCQRYIFVRLVPTVHYTQPLVARTTPVVEKLITDVRILKHYVVYMSISLKHALHILATRRNTISLSTTSLLPTSWHDNVPSQCKIYEYTGERFILNIEF